MSQPAANVADRPLAKRKKPLWKKLGVACASLIVFALVTEVAARVVSYFAYDRNAYYLMYGFVSWTNDAGEGHSVKLDGYEKFPANRILTTFGNTPQPARINNHGFRGADFEAAKPADVVRVIAMGESSTFGYEDSDTGTYPFLLEREFANDGVGGKRVEVLNCGMPHANSDNIRAMLEQELIGYEPDLLTLMCGYNDAQHPLAETAGAKFSRLANEYSAAYAGLRKTMEKAQLAQLDHKWSAYGENVTSEKVALQLALHERMTRNNLRAILMLARDRHVPIVLIRQTMTGYFEAEKRGQAPPERPTYAAETARVADKLAAKGALYGYEARLHIHRKLMDIVEEFAREFGVPLVDNAALVDADPARYLVTTVHLSEDANLRLARALAPVARAELEKTTAR